MKNQDMTHNQTIESLLKVNKFSLELSLLHSNDNLNEFINRNLKEIFGAEMSIYSEYNQGLKTLIPKHIELSPGLLEKLIGLIGSQIQKLHTNVSEEMYKVMTSETIGIRDSLSEVSFGTIPKPIAMGMEALLQTDRFVGITYLIENVMYGTALLAFKKDNPLPEKEILQNFILLAAATFRRKRAEEELLAKTSLLVAQANATIDGILVVDGNRKKSFINRRTIEIFNVPKNIVENEDDDPLLDHVVSLTKYPDDFRERVSYLYDHQNEISSEKIELKNGKVLERYSAPVLGTDKKYYGRIWTFRDITERFKTEHEIARAISILESTMEATADGILVVNNQGKLVRVNSKFNELFGIPVSITPQNSDEILNYVTAKLKKPELFSERIGDLYNSAGKISLDQIELKDGRVFERYSQPQMIGDTVHGRVWSFRNISDHKRAEQELIKAKEMAEESDRLKSAFLANMSHEIRTPMNGILGFANLLKEPNLNGEEQQEYIRIIEKSGTRMLKIINDIIDISKIESGLMDVIISESDLNEQLDYIYTFFKPEVETKGMEFVFNKKLSPDESVVLTDREKIYAILTNLVKNAIKYSEKGFIEIGCFLKGMYVEFYVKDTGMGIPADRQTAIFERFIQADISDKMALQGAGLGLSITKAYVEMLGGEIWVESKEGKGSIFSFTIPYTINTQTRIHFQETHQGEENPVVTRGLKILIAEDDEISEILISMIFKNEKNEVLSVRTGIEAVDMLHAVKDIDLVLMDIQMPGMNGYEATRLIRQFNKHVVIIAQTAYGLLGDREKAIEAGCSDYISKPIEAKKLLSLIDKHFRI
jgi:PAS domain S-box-containing protein